MTKDPITGWKLPPTLIETPYPALKKYFPDLENPTKAENLKEVADFWEHQSKNIDNPEIHKYVFGFKNNRDWYLTRAKWMLQYLVDERLRWGEDWDYWKTHQLDNAIIRYQEWTDANN